MDDDDAGAYDDYDAKGKGRAADGVQSAHKGTSDFVKKLFSMLDDKAYESVVAWSPSGESFIVKDMNDFTKHVLPRNFRHSNFASFVRQLNKYDFHKVKNPEDGSGTVGEHVWEFQHPDFVRGREDLLENVKRKIPAKKKGPLNKGGLMAEREMDDSPSIAASFDVANEKAGVESYADLKAQVANLTALQDQMQNHIIALTKQYQGVIGEMLTFQRNMVQQDQLMQNLIQYLMNLEQDRRVDGVLDPLPGPAASAADFASQPGGASNASNERPFLAPGVTDKLVSAYEDAGAASFAQMNETSRRAADSSSNNNNNNNNNSLRGPLSVNSSDPSGPEASSSTNAASSTRMSGITSAPSTVAPLSPKSVASPMDGNNSGKTPETSQQLASLREGNPLAPMILQPPYLGREDAGLSRVNAANGPVRNPGLSNFEKAGLPVFGGGTLQPREDGTGGEHRNGSNIGTSGGIPGASLEQVPNKRPQLDASNGTSTIPTATSFDTSSSRSKEAAQASGDNDRKRDTPTESGNYLRVRRSTLVPGWTVPPRVLLVDDDEVCRRLSSKFLQVFGCSIDYAVDGMSAVNKMNLEKYDLVLMDIVMPNLDGVSATSLIRQFDPRTPIISMTSNSGPSELINYMSSGMTDILPKPFTKEGLLNMLEKHLLHLKTVQQGVRGMSLSGTSDQGALQQALTMGMGTGAGIKGVSPSPSASGGNTGAGDATPSNGTNVANGEGEGSLNPLAGMGFTDEEYVAMLQNLIAAGTGDNDDAGGLAQLIEQGMSASKENTPSRASDMGPSPATSTARSPFPPGALKRSASSYNNDDGLHPMRNHHQQPSQAAPDANKRGKFHEIP